MVNNVEKSRPTIGLLWCLVANGTQTSDDMHATVDVLGTYARL